MPLEEYPHNNLPLPQQKGYSLNKGQTFARSEMEGGNVRQRKKFTSKPDDLQLTFIFDLDEFELFEGWYKHKIADGADWFRMKVSDGSGVNLQDCRFTGSYKTSKAGPLNVSVSASMECRDRTIINESTVDSRIT